MEYGKDLPERRRRLLVDKPFQYGLMRLLGAVWLVNMVVTGGIIYYLYAGPVFRVDHLAFEPNLVSVHSSPPQFGVLLTLGAVAGLGIVMAVGLHMSHQVAGPLAQLKSTLREAARGNLDVELHFRDGDYLADLPEYFNELVRVWKERTESDIETLRAIEAGLDESSSARTRLRELREEKEALVVPPAPGTS